jgi:hypothetical protein
MMDFTIARESREVVTSLTSDRSILISENGICRSSFRDE